jgi:hypothetical protein
MKLTKRIVNRINYTLDEWRSPVSVKKLGSKRALLSYIVHPFRMKGQLFHCNIIESLQIAEALSEKGYSVDVVDYRYKRKIDYSEYDLIVGLGTPFRRSFESQKPTFKRICYLTGASPNFSNLAEAKRINAVYQRKGKYLKARREVYWPWAFGAINADAVIVTGNEWTASTFNGINDRFFTVPVPYISNNVTKVENAIVQKEFVWFSGEGAVHKGLDLALEAACYGNTQFNLHVCGNIKNEKDFLDCYESELFKQPNIFFHGMIDPNGDAMQKIVKASSFVLLPSCSEGSASSVITCMALGLIPIVTRESGISLKGFGIEIEEDTPAGVRQAMEKANKMSETVIREQKKAAIEFVHQQHSAENYKKAFSYALTQIIE